MKPSLLEPFLRAACLRAGGLSPAHAADDAATFTANINRVGQYRFCGVDQTWGRPAVQGGFDASLPAGWYAGVWASNVSGNSYPGGNLEFDDYGGYNGKINDDFSFTLGGYGCAYPGANCDRAACPSSAFAAPCALPSKSLDTFEFNAGATWKWIAYKLSVSATDYFGADTGTGYRRHTRGTLYHDLTITYPFSDSLSLAGHVGRTDVRGRYGSINPECTDCRLALAKTFNGDWSLSAAVVVAPDGVPASAPCRF